MYVFMYTSPSFLTWRLCPHPGGCVHTPAAAIGNYAKLCYATLCYAWLCYATFLSALLCSLLCSADPYCGTMPCCASLGHATLGYAMQVGYSHLRYALYAMLRVATACNATQCFAVLGTPAMLCHALLCHGRLDQSITQSIIR